MEKTNVLRALDQAHIKYDFHEYDNTETNGENVAKLLNEDVNQVFKTLVTISNTKEHFIFIIPVNETLNLKKAAKAAKVKSIEMIKQKELFPLTGYVHGGCSPIGMKKEFKSFINETAILFDKILVSGGRIGLQIEINPDDLKEYIKAEYVDIV